MDQHLDIIKRLEEENSLLKKQLSQLEADVKKYEKEHEEKARLEENESIFRNIIENSLSGVALIGEGNVVKEWNRRFEDMLGISKAEVVGKNLWDVFNMIFDLDTYSKEAIEELRSRLNAAISHEQQTSFVQKIVNLKTRQERTIHTIYFPVNHSDKCTMCIICRDITVDETNEKELQVEKERLQVQVNILH